MGIRVELDRDRCSGHGRCYTLAPGVFGADDDGYGTVLAIDVPAELEAEAHRGALNCPEDAISIVEV